MKISPPPCIRSTRLYSCILENNIKLLGIFAARKMFWVDIVSFSLVKNLYFYIVMPTFVLHTLMCHFCEATTGLTTGFVLSKNRTM